jgi:hypothetical protein
MQYILIPFKLENLNYPIVSTRNLLMMEAIMTQLTGPLAGLVSGAIIREFGTMHFTGAVELPEMTVFR